MRATPPPRYRPTAATRPAPSALDAVALHEALGGDERRGDHRPRLGRDGHLRRGQPRSPIAGDASSRWPSRRRAPWRSAFFTYDQLQRSWYMFFFQHALADMVVGMDDLAFIDRLWADWSPGLRRRRGPRPREGRAARPRQPRRRHRLLPGHAGRRRRRPALDAVQATGDDATAAADAVPARRHRRLHGRRGGRRPARAFLTSPGSRLEIVDGCRALPPRREARPRSTGSSSTTSPADAAHARR